MDIFTGNEIENLLRMTLLVHGAMALVLFGIARMAERNALTWGIIGLLGGFVGLVAYIVVSLGRPQSVTVPRKRRFGTDDEELAAHLISQTNMHGDRDYVLDELINEGYFDKARIEAREKMQQAFNYGDGMRERIYRSYIQRIDEMTGQTVEMHG
ncbi:MAG: hypothetical protein R3F46_06855 [bacterium]